ncbi:MAG: hypothetical protein PHR77_03740 [Kiritimatiellae bacterium]|nr:hypothetical protein [Kiritimatiellia bacterium]MDD5521941.1 hypothetical protein [Kiritimatiellia bacterium]
MKTILDKLDKLAPREKLALVFALVFAICYLMDQFVIRSFVRRLKEIDGRIEQAKIIRNDNLFLLAREKELKAEYDRISNAIARAASSSEAMAVMKGEVYDIAKKTGLMINAMDQKEPKDSKSSARSYEEYIVEISKFDAETKNLISFLYRMDMSPGMTRVLKLNTNPGKTKDSVTGSLLLSKVMIVENAGRPKAAAPTGNLPASAVPKR